MNTDREREGLSRHILSRHSSLPRNRSKKEKKNKEEERSLLEIGTGHILC